MKRNMKTYTMNLFQLRWLAVMATIIGVALAPIAVKAENEAPSPLSNYLPEDHVSPQDDLTGQRVQLPQPLICPRLIPLLLVKSSY
ncbi:MAG: hypothetical protein HC796_00685 [Synechococcaceae cyanobacterium RL_1_2]|nr:hypothetical protein [Synechococcaceae cyanobacterium RL_1_2]